MFATVCEKNMCTGCNACVNICPKQCIQIKDSIKSLNAEINKNLCIDCKMCEKVCQVVNKESKFIELNPTKKCLEGVTKINDINNISSSGGFATTLGVEFAKDGGYVVGIRNDLDEFTFDITNNPDEVKKFSGSKYVKVSPKNIYKSIKDKLKENKVLFIGVPCQIAGLKMYLQKEYDNLYTIDLICHGTPSDKVLMKYLKEENIDTFKGISFRKKNMFFLAKDNQSIINKNKIDPYSIGFLQSLFYTENCYHCRYCLVINYL